MRYLKKGYLIPFAFITIVSVFFLACSRNEDTPSLPDPTPFALTFPAYFDAPVIPPDNPTTWEGVALGRRLFYEPLLSGDNTQSCGSCHNIDFAFTDNNFQFSTGIQNIQGDRNGMAIINLAWETDFFWDGRSKSLEDQALGPVENPVEMHEVWTNAVKELSDHPEYPSLFQKAFGTKAITKELAAKAMAQFERTIISSNSAYDENYLKKAKTNESIKNPKTALERGMTIFYTKGDCWHCHGPVGDYLFTDRTFHNNGLDSIITDPGLQSVTKNPMDRGKFKTPTLRNVQYTGPYMHDGRFKTIDEVIEHYNSGVKLSPTLDPNMKELAKGLQLTSVEKAELKEFLLSLSDQTFINNQNFKKP